MQLENMMWQIQQSHSLYNLNLNSNEVDISFGREQIDLFTFLLLFLYF